MCVCEVGVCDSGDCGVVCGFLDIFWIVFYLVGFWEMLWKFLLSLCLDVVVLVENYCVVGGGVLIECEEVVYENRVKMIGFWL